MTDKLLQEWLKEKMKMIIKYLIKIGANPTDAEDIVQETVYKFMLYMDSIDPDKASSWLFKVAINHYYDFCRKKKRNIHVEIEKYALQDNGVLPEDAVQREEVKKEIHEVLSELQPIYKHLLVLKYDLDLTYDEISEMLDIKRGTVKTYLFRAREKFKEIYKERVDGTDE